MSATQVAQTTPSLASNLVPVATATVCTCASAAAEDASDTVSVTSTSSEQKDTEAVRFVAETLLPTLKGYYRIRAYQIARPTDDTTVSAQEQQAQKSRVDNVLSTVKDTKTTALINSFVSKPIRANEEKDEVVCLIVGDIKGKEDVPMRVHDQCFTSEVFGSLKCDCREQLHSAMDYIKEHGGIVMYMRQEGRGIGLLNKFRAYALQEFGLDTIQANHALGFEDDTREYECVPHILKDLDVKSIQLLTNNPRKINHLRSLGVNISGRIPVIVPTNPHNEFYLAVKRDQMGHMLNKVDVTTSTSSSTPSSPAASSLTASLAAASPVSLAASSASSKTLASTLSLNLTSPPSPTASTSSSRSASPTHSPVLSQSIESLPALDSMKALTTSTSSPNLQQL